MQHSPDPVPFIIWTLRRTGGTNLATTLFARSPCPSVGHEPFNLDRKFGQINADCRSGVSETEISARLDEILAGGVLMKHCVEKVPRRFNPLLASVSMARGYRHVFLYRRNPLDRLLSLHFAERSGVWGKRLASTTEIDDAIFAEPLPVAALVRHETACRETLQSVYVQLRMHGVEPLLVEFEDIYGDSDKAAVRARLLTLLGGLGLASGDGSDDAFVDDIVSGGDQGTRSQYTRFVNHAEMAERVGELGLFDLRAATIPGVERTRPLPAGIDVADVWPPSLDDVPGRMTVAGVVFSAQDPELKVFIEDDDGLREAPRDQPSPRIAKRFPQHPAAARARFRLAGIRVPGVRPVRVLAVAGGREPVEVARISASVPQA